jgi:hypothetical protein
LKMNSLDNFAGNFLSIKLSKEFEISTHPPLLEEAMFKNFCRQLTVAFAVFFCGLSVTVAALAADPSTSAPGQFGWGAAIMLVYTVVVLIPLVGCILYRLWRDWPRGAPAPKAETAKEKPACTFRAWAMALAALFLSTACAGNPYRMPVREWAYAPPSQEVASAPKSSQQAASSKPKGYYLVVFDRWDSPWPEAGVFWYIHFGPSLWQENYGIIAMDADGDGRLEALVPEQFFCYRFVLVSHAGTFYSPAGEIKAPVGSDGCRRDLKIPEDLNQLAPLVSPTSCRFISFGSELDKQVQQRWVAALQRLGLCKQLTPSQIEALRRTDPEMAHRILNVAGNLSAIAGLWFPALWAMDPFRALRTLIELNYAAQSVPKKHVDKSMYFDSTVSRFDYRDLRRKEIFLQKAQESEDSGHLGFFYRVFTGGNGSAPK